MAVFFCESIVTIARVRNDGRQADPPSDQGTEDESLLDLLTSDTVPDQIDASNSDDAPPIDAADAPDTRSALLRELEEAVDPTRKAVRTPPSPEFVAQARIAADRVSQILFDAHESGGVIERPSDPEASPTTPPPTRQPIGSSGRTVVLAHEGCLQCPYLVPSSSAASVTGTFYSKSAQTYVTRTVPIEKLPCRPLRNSKCPARTTTLVVRTAADRQADSVLEEARQLAATNASPQEHQALMDAALRMGRTWPERLRTEVTATLMQLLSRSDS